jgi:hypothetical protein
MLKGPAVAFLTLENPPERIIDSSVLQQLFAT